MTDEHAKRETGEWILSATLAGTNEVEILTGVGERLNAAGVSLVRVSVRVGENMRLRVGEGITASWTTDAPGGFPDAQVELLAGIMPALTLAFVLRTAQRDARANRGVGS